MSPAQSEGAPQRLVMRIRHFNRGLEPWRSEAEAPMTLSVQRLGKNEVVFEDTSEGFLPIIHYRREGDVLQVKVLSPFEDGHNLEFNLKQVAD